MNEIKKILHKWDDVPMPENPFAAARLDCAKVSCSMLERLLKFSPKEHLVTVIAHFARKALLTAQEKEQLFGQLLGKHTITDLLAEEIIFDGCTTATILAALEWIDSGRFPQAAVLFSDINRDEWSRISFEWDNQWNTCRNPDAALVHLLANRCGGVNFEEDEIHEMEQVTKRQWPEIDNLFNLVTGG